MDSRQLSEVIGINAHAARKQLDLTLSDVSRELRNLGVNWSPGWLSDIENGRFTPSMKIVCLLALALTEADDNGHVSPLQLLQNNGPVELGERLILSEHGYKRLMSGELDALRAGDVVGGVEELSGVLQDSREWSREVSTAYERFSTAGQGELKRGELKKARKAFALADSRAAQRVEMTEPAFLGASLALWGRLMSEEVDARAPEGSSAQKRGHITRELIAELEQRRDSDRGDH